MPARPAVAPRPATPDGGSLDGRTELLTERPRLRISPQPRCFSLLDSLSGTGGPTRFLGGEVSALFRWKGMGAGPWGAGRTDCRCRSFSWWPLSGDNGGSALQALAQGWSLPGRPPLPAPLHPTSESGASSSSPGGSRPVRSRCLRAPAPPVGTGRQAGSGPMWWAPRPLLTSTSSQ